MEVVPVPPLLDAVEEVLADGVDVLGVAVAAAVQQGQAGLDEGTGGLVQRFFGFARVSPAQLRLQQDQIHQADQLISGQLQDKLLSAFLEARHKLLSLVGIVCLYPAGARLRKIHGK